MKEGLDEKLISQVKENGSKRNYQERKKGGKEEEELKSRFIVNKYRKERNEETNYSFTIIFC